MKGRTQTLREAFLAVVLAILVLGLAYYWLFYRPLQADLDAIAVQTEEVSAQVEQSLAKLTAMDAMREELNRILAQPADEISEIAPYDNATVVMSQLNNILSTTTDYSLSFRDPVMQDDGIVRRTANMTFTCDTYAAAKDIVEALAASHWRCLINSVAISAQGQQSDATVIDSPVSVQATVTFIESTNFS
jgi:hypothetical protein